MRSPVAAFTLLSFCLAGCAVRDTALSPSASGLTLRGVVHGGQQPIVGAHVYLLAASTSGYGGFGIPASALNASTSLLTASTGASDAIGYYVATGTDGSFSITGDYACSPSTQVYLYVLGGNPGAGTNSAVGLMAALGSCPSAGNFTTATPYVWVNEVSTIAAAYAMAGFATDATHVSSSGTALARIGIANAFANATNLAALSTGVALTTTPAGNGTVPQTTIDSLANILAACVNSTGPSSATCSTLFANAKSAGSSGTQATDTASVAINIAHNPAANISTLYNLPAAALAFSPALAAAPNDFTLGLRFTGPANVPFAVAIDASGDAWFASSSGVEKLSSLGANLSGSAGFTFAGEYGGFGPELAIDQSGNVWTGGGSGYNVTKLSSSGTVLSGSNGYTGGMIFGPSGIALDASGDAWVANYNSGLVTELSSSGTILSGTGGFTGGGIVSAQTVAIDGSGNAWVQEQMGVAKLSPTGTSLSGTGFATGVVGSSLGNTSAGIALDSSGNAWVANFDASTLYKLSNAGVVLAGNSGYSGGGLLKPSGLSIDGAGNVWVSNRTGGSVSEFSSSGVALSGTSGYRSGVIAFPEGIAVDGSGDVWIANDFTIPVTELIGAAVPVITPIVAGLPTTLTTDGSSNLGTRP